MSIAHTDRLDSPAMPATATLADLDNEVNGKPRRRRAPKPAKNPPLEPMGDVDTKHRAYTDEPPLPTSVLEMEEVAAIYMGKSCPPLSDDQLARQEHCPIGLGGKAKAIYIMTGMSFSQQSAVARREREANEHAAAVEAGRKPRKARTAGKGKGTKGKGTKSAQPAPDGSLTAGDVALQLETDAKTLRRFLRQSDFEKGEGGWAFQPDQVDAIRTAFTAWAK